MQQTLTVAAAKETGSTATHNIRKARAAAIRLSGGRLSNYQYASADSESTTTSTSFQQKLTKSWNVSTAGNWLLMSTFNIAGSSARYSNESRVQLSDSTVMAQPLVEPNDTTDYTLGASIDVRSLATGTRFVDVDYRSENTSATAKIRYAHIVAVPLDEQGGVADLVITTTSLPNGQIGVAYSQMVQATGGVTPYSWSIVSGSLPAGLSLGSSTGTISGTPTTSGTLNFTVRVTDSQGTPDTDDQALSIYIPADLVVTTSSLPGGQTGVAYSQTLAATGGTTPYSWSVISGSLPAGLSLGSSTGTISGTPTATGTSNFTVRVTDSQSPADTATKALSITISAGVPDLVITTTSLPNGQIGVAYSQTVQATGGVTPYSWSIVSGSLPAGLSLGSSTGTLSGTPTASGTSNFTVRVTDSQGTPDTDDQALSIYIPADLNITTTSLPGGSVGAAYSQTLAATGGATPYSWSVVSGSLPSGLSLGSSTGTISGTPTASGTSNFTVRVTDSQSPADTDDQALSITITSGGTYNVTLQDGLNGYTGTRDNWLDSDYPTTNNGTVVQAHLQYNTQDRQIHSFDLSSIPSNATITSATISFYVYNVTGGTPNVNCYRILKEWDELQSTYNNRLTGTAWGTPGLLSGTDYAATAIASSGNISAAGWANFTITSTVQAWVNGSQTNYGVMYRESSAGHLYTRMSEYTTDTSQRPKLVINYTTP